jgi:hypothetical protein
MKISKKSLMLMGGGSIILIIFIYIALYKETKEEFQKSTSPCDIFKPFFNGKISPSSILLKGGIFSCDIEANKKLIWPIFRGSIRVNYNTVDIYDKKVTGTGVLPKLPVTITMKNGLNGLIPALFGYFCKNNGTSLLC